MASENERLWQKPKWSTLGKSAVKPVHDCGQRVLATDASRAWERVDALLGSQQAVLLDGEMLAPRHIPISAALDCVCRMPGRIFVF